MNKIIDDFKNLRFLSQNVNSLNISTVFKTSNTLNKFSQKLEAILTTKADIIFLQDIRLKNNFTTFKKYLNFNPHNPYDSYINSTLSNRGVAILINKRVNYSILDTIHSACNNYILMKLKVGYSEIIIGSIYGPTEGNDQRFLPKLRSDIEKLNCENILISGDFNAVSDNRKLTVRSKINLDVKNMKQIPNPVHSNILAEWANSHFLFDIFRTQNPEKKTYSHFPFNKRDNSRSRIDLILGSPNLINLITNIKYNNIPTLLFDHTPLTFSFSSAQPNNRVFMDPAFLDISGLDQRVFLSYIQTHLDYCCENFRPDFLNNSKEICSNLRLIFSQIIDLIKTASNTPDDLLLTSWISQKCDLFDLTASPLKDSDYLYNNTRLILDADLYLKTLLNNIQIDLISHQRQYKKLNNNKHCNLKQQIDILRQEEHEPNTHKHNTLNYLEQKLRRIEDDINLRKCKNTKLWTHLNNEKPTKAFCSLAKNLTKPTTTKHIKKPNNNGDLVEYETNEQRNDDIVDFYKNIYSNKPTKTETITSFLGNNIITNPEVLNKKLTEQEKEQQNCEITLKELTDALNETKNGTAPGLDGYTYKILKRYWSLIGLPIKLGFDKMIENGQLYDTLKTATIRLIPKKGNTEHIKNWRPIALLSNISKVYSKAYSNRLKTVLNKITSQSQKAYSSEKILPEAIINILTDIHKANLENLPLAIVAIDFKKAFDSVGHEFIIETLKFFNFSPYMIKIFECLCKGREGTILTEEGFTKFFNIACGVAQGDSPSGLIFLIVLEILLIRLAFDPNITRTKFNDNTESNDAAFADDVSILVECTPTNMTNIKNLLQHYQNLSGLTINTEKTVILPVNPPPNFEQNIINTGYTCTEQLTILGFNITNNATDQTKNINKIKTKIHSNITFWNKFNLSLPGRITIAKTYLLSQIAFFAPVIHLDQLTINYLEDEISKFIINKLRISKTKVYAAIENGGLGMIPLKPYIDALKTGMFRRSLHKNDKWCHEIVKLQTNNNDKYHLKTVNNPQLPTDHIINSTVQFIKDYNLYKGNILDARICYNTLLRLPTGQMLQKKHFRNNLTVDSWNQITSLRLFNLIDPTTKQIKDRERLNRTIGIELNNLEYLHLLNLIRPNLNKYNLNLDQETQPIRTFMNKIIKGSKKFRLHLQRNNIHNINEHKTLNGLTARLKHTNETNITHNNKSNFYNIFKNTNLPNSFREFVYKFNNNILYTNTALSKFLPDINESCSICLNHRTLPAPRETIKHIFFECQHIREINNILHTTLLNNNNNTTIKPETIFLGVGPEDIKTNTLTLKEQNLLIMIHNRFLYRAREKHRHDYRYGLLSEYTEVLGHKNHPREYTLLAYVANLLL